MAKKRKKNARKVSQRPKAPRTDAQIAAAQANIAKAQAAKAEKAAQESAQPSSHPADANRPKAFFTFSTKRERAQAKADAKAEAKASAPTGQPSEKPEPRGLTLDEMRSMRDKLIAMLVSLWELADKGLTLTALLDGEDAFIWRSIDDDDTAFLADRILAKGRANPFVGAQVRAVIDHWQDARMTMILGPRLLESAGWYQARGLKVAFAGIEVPPKAARRPRRNASNGHQGQPGATAAYQPSGQEGAMYGAQ